MKNILLTTSLATLISASFISDASADPFQGMYAGGHLGYERLNLNPKGTSTCGKIVALGINKVQNLVPFGIQAGISTMATPSFYLAAEAVMDFALKQNVQTYSPGLKGKAGFRASERVVIAATAGGVLTNFQLKNPTTNKTLSQTKFGLSVGMEAIVAANDKNLVSLAYEYIKYNQAVFGVTTLRPTSYSITLRYSYRF
jgi:opacity protein-like surface antigen